MREREEKTQGQETRENRKLLDRSFACKIVRHRQCTSSLIFTKLTCVIWQPLLPLLHVSRSPLEVLESGCKASGCPLLLVQRKAGALLLAPASPVVADGGFSCCGDIMASSHNPKSTTNAAALIACSLHALTSKNESFAQLYVRSCVQSSSMTQKPVGKSTLNSCRPSDLNHQTQHTHTHLLPLSLSMDITDSLFRWEGLASWVLFSNHCLLESSLHTAASASPPFCTGTQKEHVNE